MNIDYDEYFRQLRVTTMDVTKPLVALSVHRMTMIHHMVKYIQTLPRTADREKILKQYNTFIERDKELVEVTKGNIDNTLNPSK